jgi:prolycopene isomerase
LTHIGLKGVPTEVLRKVHGYYWDSWDPELVGKNALRFKIFSPTLYDPDLAPPECHIVVIQKVVDIDYPAIVDWAAHKAAIERYIMDNLEDVVPGITEKIVVRLSASALTSYRFTLNHQGAMLGWEMSPDEVGSSRPDVTGPLKNLYLVGHWVQPGGGITPVIVSASKVANLITQCPPL